MDASPVTLECFISRFGEVQNCIRALYASKWPDGFRCPRSRCNNRHAYCISTRRLPLYECSACGAQTSIIAGTIMAGSRTPLHLWFYAIYLHAHPHGINALQLSRMIGVTYKTAWLICHKIRHAMQLQQTNEFLTGLVHIATATLFRRATPSLYFHKQEQPVLAAFSESPSGQIDQIKIKKQNKEQLRSRFQLLSADAFVREHVSSETTSRPRVTPRNQVVRLIAQNAQDRLAQLFRGIGPKHLQVYLDQYCYVWNRRSQSIFRQLLSNCATTCAITYPELVMIMDNHLKTLPRTTTPSKRIAKTA